MERIGQKQRKYASSSSPGGSISRAVQVHVAVSHLAVSHVAASQVAAFTL